MASDPGNDPVSLTRDGKRLLRERYLELKEADGLSLEKLGARIGCSHGQIRLLLHDEGTIGTAMDPVWSSPLVPALCRELGVPLWEVIAGLDDAHRRALAAVDHVRAHAPDALAEFLDGVEDLAAGKVSRHAREVREELSMDSPPIRPA